MQIPIELQCEGNVTGLWIFGDMWEGAQICVCVCMYDFVCVCIIVCVEDRGHISVDK